MNVIWSMEISFSPSTFKRVIDLVCLNMLLNHTHCLIIVITEKTVYIKLFLQK